MILRNQILEITSWIDRPEIIFFTGARQVGKSTLMKYFQGCLQSEGKSTFFFNFDNPLHLRLGLDYSQFVSTVLQAQQRVYVFIDEIQMHPQASQFLKFLFDTYASQIKIFVSGSAQLELKARVTDSLAGRKIHFQISPFDFDEFLRAKNYTATGNPYQDEVILQGFVSEYLTYGGLPQVVLSEPYFKPLLLTQYVSDYISMDVRSLVKQEHIGKFNQCNQYIAANIGNILNKSSLQNEVGMHYETLQRYLDILSGTYVLDLVEPWSHNVSSRIRKNPKVYFYDIGVRNALLNDFSDIDLRRDKGALWENFVYLQLKKQSENIYYLRTSNDNEIDFITQSNRKLSAYEVKYQVQRFQTVPAHFKNLAAKISADAIYICHRGYESYDIDGVRCLGLGEMRGRGKQIKQQDALTQMRENLKSQAPCGHSSLDIVRKFRSQIEADV